MFQDRFEKRLLLHMLTLEMGHLSHAIRNKLKSESDLITVRLRDTLGNL